MRSSDLKFCHNQIVIAIECHIWYSILMYIREVKTKIKGKTYIVHRLVEAYKTVEGKPRQRVIMHLGTLDVPKNRWKELAYLLEQRVLGQTAFLSLTPDLDTLADELHARGSFSKSKPQAQEQAEQERDLATVDLNSVSMSESRSLGPELVCDHMWNKLGFEEILEDCRMKPQQISVAKALILGKLIHPSSELDTWRWLNTRTALVEMTPRDIAGLGKDLYYEVADILYANKDKIEMDLYTRETTLFSLERRLFLFDLTNTYMEGDAKGNGLAKYGKSKEKRQDCPLISLALMVDDKGFPVYSRICKGNQSEPKALNEVLEELETNGSMYTGGKKPIIVMDRGIATRANITIMKEKGYSYTVIERGPAEKEYEASYEELKGILQEENSQEKLSNLGWQQIGTKNGVYIKGVECEDFTKVLCYSVRKEAKELSMDRLKEQRFLEDIEKLKKSIEAGNIMIPHKVGERIGRIRQKYPGIGTCYDIDIIYGEDQKLAKSLQWSKKRVGEQRPILAGCYVIETDRKGLNAEEIWHDYITITRVEAAFRDLKSELGLRPIYHQTEERTKSHLLIGVLAYHLLVGIENTLLEKGDHREWKTIKSVLSTHQRATIIFTGEDRTVYNIRVSGNPESEHLFIYNCFGIKDCMKRKKTMVNQRK